MVAPDPGLNMPRFTLSNVSIFDHLTPDGVCLSRT